MDFDGDEHNPRPAKVMSIIRNILTLDENYIRKFINDSSDISRDNNIGTPIQDIEILFYANLFNKIDVVIKLYKELGFDFTMFLVYIGGSIYLLDTFRNTQTKATRLFEMMNKIMKSTDVDMSRLLDRYKEGRMSTLFKAWMDNLILNQI